MVAVGDDILAEHINLFLNRPMCHLVQAATQTMNDNATNAITFGSGSEVIDYGPAPFHDVTTNNTRITPTIPGWYEVEGKVVFTGLATMDFLVLDCFLRTNGSSIVAGSSGRRTPPLFSGTNSTTNSHNIVVTGTHPIQFNGLTDYVELLGVQTNSPGGGSGQSTTTSASGQFASVLRVKFVRLA